MTIKVGDKVLVWDCDLERDVLYIHQAPGDSRVYYVVAYKGDMPESYLGHHLKKVKPKTSVWVNTYTHGYSGPAYNSRKEADLNSVGKRVGVVRIDMVNGVSTLHLEAV